LAAKDEAEKETAKGLFKKIANIDENTIQNEEMEGGEEGEEKKVEGAKVRDPFKKNVTNGLEKVLNTLDDSVYSLTFVSMIKDI
jgi:hypothetical protein